MSSSLLLTLVLVLALFHCSLAAPVAGPILAPPVPTNASCPAEGVTVSYFELAANATANVTQTACRADQRPAHNNLTIELISLGEPTAVFYEVLSTDGGVVDFETLRIEGYPQANDSLTLCTAYNEEPEGSSGTQWYLQMTCLSNTTCSLGYNVQWDCIDSAAFVASTRGLHNGASSVYEGMGAVLLAAVTVATALLN